MTDLEQLAATDPAAAVRTWLTESGALVPTFIAEALAKVTASHDVLHMTRRSPLPGPLTDHDRKVLTEWISGRLPVFGHGDRIRGMVERLLHLTEQLDADNKRLVETLNGVVDAHAKPSDRTEQLLRDVLRLGHGILDTDTHAAARALIKQLGGRRG